MICVACGRANREGARFCDDCGELLTSRCRACEQELRPDARFCDACGTPVAESAAESVPAAAPTGSRKVVTLVFADLAGSTSLQERMDAESVRRVMDRFYDAMRAAVAEHGGTVVKFMGDGLMAAFGVPAVAEDDAVRAVRAAAAMQEAFVAVADEVGREWDAGVGLRVGVNTGEVVVAEGEDDVVGDAVNVAARLEHAAAEGQVLVGQETWRLTRDLFTFEEIPPLDLKGKSERVAAHRLVALAPPAADEASPFVGRGDELARMTAAFEAAVEERRARLVTVIGSPGLGKSRMMRELSRRLAGRGVTYEGQCEASGSSTFAPVADVLRAIVGIDETASADDAVTALAALFTDGGDHDDAGRIATAAASVLGVGRGVSPEETFWAVRRVIEQAAAGQPAIVIFDDVHWAEPILLDLLDHLAEWIRDAPVLLVALARPEIRDVRAALADTAATPTDVVVLDALGAEEGLQLAAELLQGHPLHEDVAAHLLTSAEGNPLFLRELVKMLVDDAVLHIEDGVWVAADGVEELEVPPTIHALLSARIERLESGERSVVERASVVGHQFFRGAVAVLSPPPVSEQIDTHLETLRRKEVVEPEGTYWIDEPVFRFHHALIRDAAYRRLLKEARAELHERVADWLATKAGDLVGEHEEIIGYHLEQAYEYRRDLDGVDGDVAGLGRRAADHLAAAARRSLDRDDQRSAAALMGRALACLPSGDASRAELLVDRCEALLGLGQITSGARAVAELEAAAGGEPRLAAWTEVFAAQIASFSEPEALPDWVDRAAAAADRLSELGDAVGTAKASAVHASILARLGQVAACEAALDRALAAAREAGDRRRANGVLAGAPLAALWGPSPVTRAAGRCLDVVRVLRITTDAPPVEAVALRAQGVLEAFRGRFEAARRLLASSRRTLEELGLRHGILQTDLFEGLVELAADDFPAAEAALRRAYDGFRALGVEVDAGQAGALLARACLAQGRDDQALELTEESQRFGGHDLTTAIAWRAVRAEALARRGEADEALRLAREAVHIAGGTDALVDHADARLALASVLAAAGDTDEADDEAQRAAELYEAKGATALAERAQRLVGGPARHTPAGELDAAFASPDVARVEGGRLAHLELYDPEDLDRPLAPSDELTGGAATEPANPVAAVWEQYRDLFPQGDIDRILATVSPDYVLEERQYHAQHTSVGHEGYRELLAAIFESQFTRVDAEVLATRGPRLALVRVAWQIRAQSGGDFEVVHLRVDEADDHALLARTVAFDADDLEAAYDELDRRCAERVDPSCRPVVEAVSARRRALNARDWDGLRILLTDDYAHVSDPLTAAGVLGERDAATLVGQLADLVSQAPDHHWHDVETLRLTPDGALHREGGSGTGPQGIRYETATYALEMCRAGTIWRTEIFHESKRAEALARFEELIANEGPSTGLVNDATRAWKRQTDLMLTPDVDAMLADIAEDIVYEERMRVPGRFSLTGHVEVAEMLLSMLARRGPTAIATEILAIRGERLALTRNTFRWAHRLGGPTEYLNLRLDETDEEGLITSVVTFEPDDLDAALEELEQRYRDGLESACRPAFELAWVGQRSFNHRDWDALRATVADDFRLVDRRLVGYGERDGDEYVEGMQSMVDMAPDVRSYTVDIVRLAPTVILTQARTSGTDGQGGRFEQVIDNLGVLVDGRWRTIELFDPAQRDQALARFAELVAGDEEPEVVNDAVRLVQRTDEQFLAGDLDGVMRRHVTTPNRAMRLARELIERIAAGDWEGAVAHHAPDVVVDERRRSAQHALGSDELEAWARGGAPEATEVELQPLAIRGERLFLGLATTRAVSRRSGGDYELSFIVLNERDDEGLLTHVVLFEPDDVDAAVEELDQRFEQQVPGELDPAVSAALGITRACRARDWGSFRAIHADDYRLVDHRPTGWGECDLDAYIGRLRSLLELAPDIRLWIAEMPRLSPSAAMFRTVARGADPEGGDIEIVVDHVSTFVDGRVHRQEHFPPERRDEAVARFEQLARLASAGPAVQVWARFVDALESGDLSGLAEIVAPRYTDHDHINDVVIDAAAELENQRVVASAADLSIEWAPVLDLGRQAAWHARYRWSSGGEDEDGAPVRAGMAEQGSFMVGAVDESGRATESHRFAEDQLHAALAVVEQRHAETASDQEEVAASRRFARFWRIVGAYNRGDWDTLRTLWADDLVTVDHRPAGWGTVEGPDAYMEVLQGLAEVSTDRRWIVRDLLCRGHRSLAAHWSVVGTDRQGGRFEMSLLVAFSFDDDGAVTRQEIFPVDSPREAVAAAEALEAGRDG